MKKRFGAIALAMILFMSFCVIPTLASAGTRVIRQDPPGQELIRWRTILTTNLVSTNSNWVLSTTQCGYFKNTQAPRYITRSFSSGADTQWNMSIGTNAQRSDLVSFPGNYGSSAGTSKTFNVHLRNNQIVRFYKYRRKTIWKWEHVLRDQYYDDETGTWQNCTPSGDTSYSVVEKVYTDYGYSLSN